MAALLLLALVSAPAVVKAFGGNPYYYDNWSDNEVRNLMNGGHETNWFKPVEHARMPDRSRNQLVL